MTQLVKYWECKPEDLSLIPRIQTKAEGENESVKFAFDMCWEHVPPCTQITHNNHHHSNNNMFLIKIIKIISK